MTTSKNPNRIKVAVYLDPKQKAALEQLSEQTRVPWAEYVREGIDMVLTKYRTVLRKGGRSK